MPFLALFDPFDDFCVLLERLVLLLLTDLRDLFSFLDELLASSAVSWRKLSDDDELLVDLLLFEVALAFSNHGWHNARVTVMALQCNALVWAWLQ